MKLDEQKSSTMCFMGGIQTFLDDNNVPISTKRGTLNVYGKTHTLKITQQQRWIRVESYNNKYLYNEEGVMEVDAIVVAVDKDRVTLSQADTDGIDLSISIDR